MAELLAVCVVVLGLFSVLFSNYLPLLAEYETRLSYNDVTSQYAVHYIRKAYYDSGKFENTKANLDFWNTSVEGGSYISLYDKKNDTTDDLCKPRDVEIFADDACDDFLNFVDQYKVSEVILSSYDITDLKDKIGKDSSLYNYVQYLPTYKKKGDAFKEGKRELYRLILKSDFGYATTAVLSENIPNDNCWEGTIDNTKTVMIDGESYPGFKVTKYKWKEGCASKTIEVKPTIVYNKQNVVITSIENREEKDSDGNLVTVGAFQHYNEESVEGVGDLTSLERISLSPLVGDSPSVSIPIFDLDENKDVSYEIGDNAFKGSGITGIELDFDIASEPEGLTIPTALPSNIKSIGASAFSSMPNLKYVNLNNTSNNLINYGISAFANNAKLEEVLVDDKNIELQTGVAVDGGLFAKSGSSGNGIAVTIEGNSFVVSNKMFYQSKVKSLNLASASMLRTIGDDAFSQIIDSNYNVANEVNLDLNFVSADKLETIGNGAFEGIGLSSLEFDENLKSIGSHSFRSKRNLWSNLDLEIPSNVSTIGTEAFQFNKDIKTLTIKSKKLSIEDRAFNDSGISDEGSLVINEDNILDDSLLKISTEAFSGCKITGVLIFPFKTNIGENAFYDNRGITEIVFKDDIEVGLQSFPILGSLSKVTSKKITFNGFKSFYKASENVVFEYNSEDSNDPYCSIESWLGKQIFGSGSYSYEKDLNKYIILVNGLKSATIEFGGVCSNEG